MRHSRRAIVPTVWAAGRATAAVAVFLVFIAIVNISLQARGPEWTDFALPLGFALAVGSAEAGWVLAKSPRKILADERGLEIEGRDGRTGTLAWTDLASRSRAIFSGRWDLHRRDGSVLKLSRIGIHSEDWKELDARVTDVLVGNGPPLAAEGEAAAAAAAEPPLPETPATLVTALAGAFAGAVLGAVVWGLIAGLTGFEVGYIALLVGFLVGGGAKRLGGQGQATGAACAVVALFAIVAGKGLAFGIAVEREIRKQQDQVGKSTYDSISRNAADWAKGVSTDQVPRFMATHGYSLSENERGVTKEELEEFRQGVQPFLESWQRLPPRYEAWSEMVRENIRAAIREQVSFLMGIRESLGILDILFAFLGASTAYRMLNKQVAAPLPVGQRRKERPARAKDAPPPLALPPGFHRDDRIGPPRKGEPVSGSGEAPPPPSDGPPPGTDPPAPRS